MKYKYFYFAISAVMIVISIYSLLTWGLKLGVDFTGGSVLEVKIEGNVSTKDVREAVERDEFELTSVSVSGDSGFIIKTPPLTTEDKNKMTELLTQSYGEVTELRYEIVGPAVGPELVKKTIYAIAIAAGIILLWVAYQFKSFKYGASAILAMFHDSFILLGAFSLLGHFYGAEVDFLFVTALLTTLSFSVHDTIVVFDRIREINKKGGGELVAVANKALTETMVRSLNNSFTIIFMLVALLLLGGTTIKWFATALLIGTVLGTYSSPFVATPLLVTFDNFEKRIKKK
ncbi:protein translocase subunit SecF [Patescibacteria group bacterium]